MLHEKIISFYLFELATYRFICHYFCYWETQWTSDAYSPFPCHSSFFVTLSYIPSIVCFPSCSFLACVIVPPMEVMYTFDHPYCSSVDLLQLFHIFFWGGGIRAAQNIHYVGTKQHSDNQKNYISFTKTFNSLNFLLQVMILSSRLTKEYCFWHRKFKFVFKWYSSRLAYVWKQSLTMLKPDNTDPLLPLNV